MNEGTLHARGDGERVGLPGACPDRVDLKGLDLDGMVRFVAELGWQRFRAVQLFKWVFQKDVTSFDEMTNLSREARRELARVACVSRMEPSRVVDSSDGSRKLVFELVDGLRIESVLIPEEERTTVCVSSQVGCPLGCKFCVTGQSGFSRNLTVAEIVGQIQAVERLLDEGRRVSNVVVMGMGEPLMNMDGLVPALRILLREHGFNLSHRRITVSTAGIVPGMERLGRELPVNLAVSLNATTEETRRALMPVSRKYSLEAVVEACRRYPVGQRKKITFEYVLLAGVNDTEADAARLVRLLRGVKAKVNLIPYNEAPGSEYRTPSFDTVKAFQDYLVKRRIHAAVRWSRGRDIGAACGQLGRAELVGGRASV